METSKTAKNILSKNSPILDKWKSGEIKATIAPKIDAKMIKWHFTRKTFAVVLKIRKSIMKF